MTRATRIGSALLLAAVAAGTWLSKGLPYPAHPGPVLVADFHVHPFPGDGALSVRQLQREAFRRGLDVIAVTGHNNQAGWRLATAVGRLDEGVIVLPGQEVTAPKFHMAAIGIPRTVNWDQTARAIIDEVHALGGAVIAAHPVESSWAPRDPRTLAALDGVEAAHPQTERDGEDARQLDEFFADAKGVKPTVAAIGSSDFHMVAPLGRCRTYVFADERSAGAIIRAVRAGRTVAEDADGRLSGPDELVAQVTPDLQGRRTARAPGLPEKGCALTAILGLALMCSRSRRRQRP